MKMGQIWVFSLYPIISPPQRALSRSSWNNYGICGYINVIEKINRLLYP
jgi:hypothetical protein